MKNRLAILAAAVVLCACATSRPPEQVAAPAPARWHAPLPHGGAVRELAAWWQQWDDPLLLELLVAAEAASPDIAAAQSRIAQARATRAAARSTLLPTLDASASVQRGNNQPPLPLSTISQAGLQTAWEIDLFGGNRAALAAARLREREAQAGWHDARVAVAAETANTYVALRTCERQLAVAENDARSRGETARLAGLAEQAGFTAPADAALARASAAEASARATQQRAQCEIELKALVALAGIEEPPLRTRLAGGWKQPAADAQWLAVAAVPADVLSQRPDVYAAELEVAAASADVGSAQAQRFPRLSLTGSIAAGVIRAGGSDTDAQTWSIGPLALSIPVFDAGRRAANAEAAQARYEEAVAVYRARVRQAVREVEQALVTLESSRLRGADARAAAEGYRASFAATEARWKSGLASQIELEDARRILLAAETALVGLERERLAAWVQLYRALGGGWKRPDTTLTTTNSPTPRTP